MRGGSFLKLRLGPLKYVIEPHDEWASNMLGHLRENLECLDFRGIPDRTIHFLEFSPDGEECARIYSGQMPERLRIKLGCELSGDGWGVAGDNTGYVCWTHENSKSDAIWTFRTETPHCDASFQLPWKVILEDIVERGGHIIHAGLAQSNQCGFLFLGPSGAGKTTALSKAPCPWEVLGDDRVLVWPTADGQFAASPLPTFSVLIGTKSCLPALNRWSIGKCAKLVALILLEKGQWERVRALEPPDVATSIYHSLSEHIVSDEVQVSLRIHLFRLASSMAKNIPTWRLEVTLQSEFWGLLENCYRQRS